MLLRRVIEHVKAQNWTAIAIDFVIVVVGVFIGIQVANRNTARLEQEAERRLVAQLAADVDTAIERREDWLERMATAVEPDRRLGPPYTMPVPRTGPCGRAGLNLLSARTLSGALGTDLAAAERVDLSQKSDRSGTGLTVRRGRREMSYCSPGVANALTSRP